MQDSVRVFGFRRRRHNTSKTMGLFGWVAAACKTGLNAFADIFRADDEDDERCARDDCRWMEMPVKKLMNCSNY